MIDVCGKIGESRRNQHNRAYGVALVRAYLSEISAQVRARRKALDLTQQDLAELARCSARFLRALETGKRTVRLDKLLDVLDVLGLELTAQLRRIP